jgi:hypothetical protein
MHYHPRKHKVQLTGRDHPYTTLDYCCLDAYLADTQDKPFDLAGHLKT